MSMKTGADKLAACIRDVLRRGLDDWIQAAEVASVAISLGDVSTDAEVQTLSMEIMRSVLQEGLMVVGGVTASGFETWDVPADEAMARIEHEWARLGRPPNLGEICWFSNTEAGDDFARSLPDARQPSGLA